MGGGNGGGSTGGGGPSGGGLGGVFRGGIGGGKEVFSSRYSPIIGHCNYNGAPRFTYTLFMITAAESSHRSVDDCDKMNLDTQRDSWTDRHGRLQKTVGHNLLP